MKLLTLLIFMSFMQVNVYGGLREIGENFIYDFSLIGNAWNASVSIEPDEFSQIDPPEIGDTLVTLHTNYGDIVIRMFPEKTPLSYENFTTLAYEGFFNDIIFHRVIENFMIQTGDPTGTGMGGISAWGHAFSSEPSSLTHVRGSVSMAHAGVGTYGSQFFIVHRDAHFLDLSNNVNGHTVFGQVVSGLEVVDMIAQVPTDFMDRPFSNVYIIRASVATYGYEG